MRVHFAEVGHFAGKKQLVQSTKNSQALPREAREVRKINNLRKGLGQECFIAFQYVSTSTPKLFTPSDRDALINNKRVVVHPVATFLEIQ
jgi:hypothetical protein